MRFTGRALARGRTNVLTAFVFGGLLVIATMLLHYEALGALSRLLPRLPGAPRRRLLAVMFGAFAAHGVEIALYAVAYHQLRDRFGLGSFSGQFEDSFSTFLYFSAECFTSLGLGDICPTGPLRLLMGMETLNGLLLIAWSASYTYVVMEKYWRRPGD